MSNSLHLYKTTQVFSSIPWQRHKIYITIVTFFVESRQLQSKGREKLSMMNKDQQRKGTLQLWIIILTMDYICRKLNINRSSQESINKPVAGAACDCSWLGMLMTIQSQLIWISHEHWELRNCRQSRRNLVTITMVCDNWIGASQGWQLIRGCWVKTAVTSDYGETNYIGLSLPFSFCWRC